MTDIEARLADPKFIATVNELVGLVMADRVSEGQVLAGGPEFEDERSWLAVEILTTLLEH